MEINQCPFCGANEPGIIEASTFDVEGREGFPTSMRCGNCGATGPWKYVGQRNHYDGQLLDLWNKRTPLTSLKEIGGREVLAVVEGLVNTKQFSQESVFSPVEGRAYIWRGSECEHPEHSPVTVIVLAHPAGKGE